MTKKDKFIPEGYQPEKEIRKGYQPGNAQDSSIYKPPQSGTAAQTPKKKVKVDSGDEDR
jgi:hypothetical protein